MKAIRIKNISLPDKTSAFTDRRRYTVSLGNGITRKFTNKAQAKQFLSEVSKYLTYKLHECNELYITVFGYYRRAWFYFDHNPETGSHDHATWYKLERSCKDNIEMIAAVFDMVYQRHKGENGNHFVFNNFYTILNSMERIIQNINAIYDKKGMYDTKYQLEILNRKVLSCKRTIETYTEEIERQFKESEEIELTIIKTA